MQFRIYSVTEAQAETLSSVPGGPHAISVSAKGWVPTSGWSHPALNPWVYIVPPKDGVLDLDFVATPPTGMVLQVFTRIGVITAFPVPAWVRGVRVHASQGDVVAMLGAELDPAVDAKLFGEGLPVPWPFPWFVPRAKKPE